MGHVIDITGQRFGRLTVIQLHSAATRSPRRNTRWWCQCECGATVIAFGVNLKSGNTESCGCLRKEKLHKHGHARPRHPTYGSWNNMLQRCTNPNDKRYKNYGGRGITVCERWHSFENFLADMGLMPEGYSIERINNDGNYEPANCTWIPRPEQGKNMRRPLSKSGYRGVSWDKDRKKWRAFNRNTFLGRFDTPDQAAEVSRQVRLRGVP